MATIDSDFIRQHVKSPDSIILRDISGGSTVLKVPGFDVVIKFGGGVTQEEAIAQSTAFDLLDPAIVRVPQVHHFHRDSDTGIGYLAMEWFDASLIDMHDDRQVEALQKTMAHLASLTRSFPGPLHRGEPQGILWEDSAPSACHTVEGLENWINTWQHTPVDLRGEEFVLCHLDTAAENILWLPSGHVCLLDWSSAGYYPRYFELAAHLKKGAPNEKIERLLQSPRAPFSISEEQHMGCLIQACANSMAYAKPMPRMPPKQTERCYLVRQPSVPQLIQDLSEDHHTGNPVAQIHPERMGFLVD
ncbi:hypothetical protein A1O3_03114 [Capronia epimyces CBS 606.96]|uniref:Aminoglycoside phosphotransferase domain-containing protein n=1 Tax=Capronia epimyces CBS 606.96 TaxID=1182542 RepID=W9YLC0_9EURO|nr:uncharacterized protein A1O3_03114 [Capronia epimyces CBS 606.96]EXJ90046.1 hypothetical protein A1O3_03114 [Capronia epimyces CBS 606.96]